jgi:hypothetical protein
MLTAIQVWHDEQGKEWTTRSGCIAIGILFLLVMIAPLALKGEFTAVVWHVVGLLLFVWLEEWLREKVVMAAVRRFIQVRSWARGESHVSDLDIAKLGLTLSLIGLIVPFLLFVSLPLCTLVVFKAGRGPASEMAFLGIAVVGLALGLIGLIVPLFLFVSLPLCILVVFKAERGPARKVAFLGIVVSVLLFAIGVVSSVSACSNCWRCSIGRAASGLVGW